MNVLDRLVQIVHVEPGIASVPIDVLCAGVPHEVRDPFCPDLVFQAGNAKSVTKAVCADLFPHPGQPRVFPEQLGERLPRPWRAPGRSEDQAGILLRVGAANRVAVQPLVKLFRTGAAAMRHGMKAIRRPGKKAKAAMQRLAEKRRRP